MAATGRRKRDKADDVVQSLVVARGQIELGRTDDALAALDRALAAARELLAELGKGVPPYRERRSGG